MKGAADKRRATLKATHWSKEQVWCGAGTGVKERGWFAAPRTLPLLLCMMRDKRISRAKGDPSGAYVELLSRQRGQGVVEMEAPEIHAFACGYRGARGVRTWHERMAILDKAGFIRTKSGNNHTYDVVCIVHPAVVVKRLTDKGLIEEQLRNTYLRQQAAGERSYEEIVGETIRPPAKVVSLRPSRLARR